MNEHLHQTITVMGLSSQIHNHNQRYLVKIWLPQDLERPMPIVVYGHGLNSRAQEAERIAGEFTSMEGCRSHQCSTPW